MISCKAPGKLILLGEYTVLNGAPALVAAVDRTASVTLEEARAFELSALGKTYRATRAAELPTLDERLGLTAAVFEEVWASQSLPKVHVRIDTAQFFLGESKLGLGSSASVAVALAHALRTLQNETATPERLFSDAYRAHRRSQGGVGSGVDIAAAAFGGVLAYRAPHAGEHAPRGVESLDWPDGLHWRTYWSGHSASTPKLIAKVNALLASAPDQARTCLYALSSAAYDGVGHFRVGDIDGFLSTVTFFAEGLEKLGTTAGADIVSTGHRHNASVASAQGAVYKPSGAGGGDVGIAFSSSPIARSPETLELRLSESGSSMEIT